MTHQVRLSFQPRLESLEDRCNPSAPFFGLDHLSVHAPLAHAVANHATPFKETLTVTAVSDGVYTYVGHANQLGHVTAFSFPDGSFTKIAHHGDQIFGQLAPTSATAGSMTF